MTLRTRRKIFYTLVAFFIILGGGIVFYAQGWRLDFTTWHFEKIGGIYVRAYPGNASIYLDNKAVQNQSGFLAPGTLISDLLPQTYHLALTATGYDDWQENASVAPSLVTQFKYAVLIPANGSPVSSSIVTTLAKQVSPANGFVITSIFATTTNSGASATSTAPGKNPYNPNISISISKNTLSVFNAALATTTETSTISGKNIFMAWISPNLAGIVQSDGQCYLYDANTNTLRNLADDAKNFAATSDVSMIAVLENRSVEIFSLTDPTVYYRFNIPNVAGVERLVWYRDQAHLFVVYPDHVAFLDFADAALKNFTTVADGTNPVYDAQSNSLYIKDPAGKFIRYAFPM